MNNVKIEGLTFSYEGSSELVLKDVNIEAEEGDFVCILGHSGCGKSTLLRLLAGLERPTEGKILIGEEEVKGASLTRSVVFQDYGLFPWKSAGDNIILALGQKYPHKSKKELHEMMLEALAKVGLPENVHTKYPKELSGGMQQRCAIARSLAVNPPILLMDEPFGALDAVTRALLQDLLLDLWMSEDKKKTVFFITHDVDEALLLANKIFVLGQQPSQVIYQCEIPQEEKPKRETMYQNEYVLRMRNELIANINRDISDRMA